MTDLDPIIRFYDNLAQTLIAQYESVSFETVHPLIAARLVAGWSALDVGCGSGRDAIAMAARGLRVTAVDPSPNMLAHARAQSAAVRWLDDRLPDLSQVTALGERYHVILVSGLWMHFPPVQRATCLETLFRLLHPDGQVYILLRHGSFSDGRTAYPVSFDEINAWCQSRTDATAHLLNPDAPDVLSRKDVSWQLVAVTRK